MTTRATPAPSPTTPHRGSIGGRVMLAPPMMIGAVLPAITGWTA